VVERAAAGLVPISRRERIRAHGPSVGLPAAGAPAHTLAGWSRDDVPL